MFFDHFPAYALWGAFLSFLILKRDIVLHCHFATINGSVQEWFKKLYYWTWGLQAVPNYTEIVYIIPTSSAFANASRFTNFFAVHLLHPPVFSIFERLLCCFTIANSDNVFTLATWIRIWKSFQLEAVLTNYLVAFFFYLSFCFV